MRLPLSVRGRWDAARPVQMAVPAAVTLARVDRDLTQDELTSDPGSRSRACPKSSEAQSKLADDRLMRVAEALEYPVLSSRRASGHCSRRNSLPHPRQFTPINAGPVSVAVAGRSLRWSVTPCRTAAPALTSPTEDRRTWLGRSSAARTQLVRCPGWALLAGTAARSHRPGVAPPGDATASAQLCSPTTAEDRTTARTADTLV
jgi:hypothetical protein